MSIITNSKLSLLGSEFRLHCEARLASLDTWYDLMIQKVLTSWNAKTSILAA